MCRDFLSVRNNHLQLGESALYEYEVLDIHSFIRQHLVLVEPQPGSFAWDMRVYGDGAGHEGLW